MNYEPRGQRARVGFFRTFGFDVAVIAAVAMVGTTATAWTMLASSPDAPTVAVMFAPWTPAEQAMLRAAEAGGRIVGFGLLTSIVIVAPEHPDYARDVAEGGAWLVADAARTGGCGLPRTK
jgi:hypothetical protein